ncbi:STAS domain-containing protein [Nonomuraea sp. NPDC048881]|uniref:STAS domain-containing protein n=1 Tax=unclassified Nonomuraea TaxID=2593643 RepID=UPI0033EBC030
MGVPHAGGGLSPAVPAEVALAVIPMPDRPGIRVSGEISASTRTVWEEALSGLARRHTGVSHVELSEVTFMDVAGVTALAIAAMGLPEGRVVVEGPPPQLPRLLEMFWPNLPQIEVAQ